MRYLCVLLMAVMLAVCWGDDDPKVLEADVYTHIKAAETKQKLLPTKTYSGTFGEIMAARVADVNDVAVEIAQAKAKVERLFVVTGEKMDVAEKIKAVISQQAKEEVNEEKKRNGEFLGALDAIVHDPNMPTATEDPEMAERMAMLWEAVTDIIERSGGV